MTNQRTAQPPDQAKPIYVGYLGVPGDVLRVLRILVPMHLVAMAISAAILAGLQRDPGDGTWSTGSTTTLEGRLVFEPYGMIESIDEHGDARSVLLVTVGKLGAPEALRELAGRRVKAEGYAIQRGGRMILELDGGASVRPIDGGATERAGAFLATPLGVQELSGEIVDPKCAFGVMKPGDGKAHRACASLCIRGGIPPMLAWDRAGGERSYCLLVDESGGPMNERVLSFIAEPVSLRGEVERRGDLLVMRVETDGIRRR